MPLWRNSLIFIRNSKTVRAPRLEKASQPLRDAGLTVDLHIRYGKRVPEIVKFADESSADLVVNQFASDRPGGPVADLDDDQSSTRDPRHQTGPHREMTVAHRPTIGLAYLLLSQRSNAEQERK